MSRTLKKNAFRRSVDWMENEPGALPPNPIPSPDVTDDEIPYKRAKNSVVLGSDDDSVKSPPSMGNLTEPGNENKEVVAGAKDKLNLTNGEIEIEEKPEIDAEYSLTVESDENESTNNSSQSSEYSLRSENSSTDSAATMNETDTSISSELLSDETNSCGDETDSSGLTEVPSLPGVSPEPVFKSALQQIEDVESKDIAKKLSDDYPRNLCLGCKSMSMAITDHLGPGCSDSAEDMFRHWYRKAEKEVMGAGDWTDSNERNEFKKKVWRQVLLRNGQESDSDN